jgi:nucleotide-binding universal stress UspA family protein
MSEFKRILVPLDGSPLSERALPVATAMAQKFGSEIVLLRVLDIPVSAPPMLYSEVSIGWERQARACAHRRAQSCLDARQREVSEQGIEVRALMCDQSPAEDILQVAGDEKVDLIVLSVHVREGLDRWTFGSVADRVLRAGDKPILLVRAR